jgi:hypothetical protein
MQEINVVHEKRTKMKLEQTDISKTKSETNATIRRQQATVPANKRKAPEEWRLSTAPWCCSDLPFLCSPNLKPLVAIIPVNDTSSSLDCYSSRETVLPSFGNDFGKDWILVPATIEMNDLRCDG